MRGTRAKALRKATGLPHPGRRHGGIIGPRNDIVLFPRRAPRFAAPTRTDRSLWRRVRDRIAASWSR